MTKRVLAGALVLALAGGGAGVAIAAGGGDDSERAISDAALERVTEAALPATGGGTVTETEVGDEDSYYEVEVRLADGGQVDVQLDRSFDVVGQAVDESPDDDG